MPVSHPKAPQIAGNPKEAEQYIGSLVRENERLREALRRITTQKGEHETLRLIALRALKE